MPGDAHAHARPEGTAKTPVDEATALPGTAEQTEPEPKRATAVEPPAVNEDSTEAETKPERSPIAGKSEDDK